jgi:hypothetical protein
VDAKITLILGYITVRGKGKGEQDCKVHQRVYTATENIFSPINFNTVSGCQWQYADFYMKYERRIGLSLCV